MLRKELSGRAVVLSLELYEAVITEGPTLDMEEDSKIGPSVISTASPRAHTKTSPLAVRVLDIKEA